MPKKNTQDPEQDISKTEQRKLYTLKTAPQNLEEFSVGDYILTENTHAFCNNCFLIKKNKDGSKVCDPIGHLPDDLHAQYYRKSTPGHFKIYLLEEMRVLRVQAVPRKQDTTPLKIDYERDQEAALEAYRKELAKPADERDIDASFSAFKLIFIEKLKQERDQGAEEPESPKSVSKGPGSWPT